MSQKTIGRYEIVEELGRGGMATVYRAYDPTLEREVALKLLPNYFAHDPEFSARFEREAKTVASLEHSAIVSMYDYGEDGEWPYFVMRLMQGGSLKERIAAGRLEPSEAIRIVDRIAGALDKAHGKGIVHRDLKPGNIMFDEDGEAYLADFGIVKLAEESESYTRTGNTVGTPAYMSPEQADGRPDIDGRSDVYALGIVLYEMLTGATPYVHDSMPRLLVMHLTEPIPNILEARPDLPSAFQEVIEKAMAKERDDRYGTAGALFEASQSALTVAAEAGAEEAAEASEPAAVGEGDLETEPEPAPTGPIAVAEAGAELTAVAEPAQTAPAIQDGPVVEPPQAATSEADQTTPAQPAVKKGGIPKWALGVVAVLVIAVIAVVVVGGGGSAAPQDEIQAEEFGESVFSIVNESDRAVCSLFVVPSSEEDVGDDLLAGVPLEPGDIYEFIGEPGPYDLYAFTCDDEIALEEFEVELQPGVTTEIGVP